jgi:hypothetical protein
MGVSDGTVLGTTKVVDHGADDTKWCLLVAGDGFTSSELGDFESAVDDFVAYLETHLTGALNWEKVNVIRLDVESDESGVDTSTTAVDTYLDGSLGSTGVARALTVDWTIATDTANAQFPEWDAMLVLVNTTEYGGASTIGGGVGAASLDPTFANEIAVHELGHAGFGLADEYDYKKGCAHDGGAEDDLGAQDVYPNASGEPVSPNVTNNRFSLKWSSFVDPSTLIPTTSNGDCGECDVQSSPVADGTVGAFEGGNHYHCNIWRPEYNCRMRVLGQPFCTVCEAHIGTVLTFGSLLDVTPCFVAGAIYGDRHHPDVLALRRWRDGHLARDARGRVAMRLLVAVYGCVGPHLAAVVAPRPRLARLLRRRVIGPAAAAARRWDGRRP